MRMMVELHAEDAEHYTNANKALEKGPLQEADAMDFWRAMRLEKAISDFRERTGLQRADIGFAVHEPTGKMFLQWRGALPAEMRTNTPVEPTPSARQQWKERLRKKQECREVWVRSQYPMMSKRPALLGLLHWGDK